MMARQRGRLSRQRLTMFFDQALPADDALVQAASEAVVGDREWFIYIAEPRPDAGKAQHQIPILKAWHRRIKASHALENRPGHGQGLGGDMAAAQQLGIDIVGQLPARRREKAAPGRIALFQLTEAHISALERLHMMFKQRGLPFVITVLKGDQWAACHLHPSIACSRRT